MTKELLQQCLDALAPHGSSYANGRRTAEDEAITAIEQALAQQEQPAQEPVAWDGKLPDTLTKALASVYNYANHDAAGDLAYQVRQAFESICTTNATLKRMFAACQKRCEELEAAPTQPAQEPVAWYLSEDSNILGVEWSRQKPKYGRDWTPLYKTAPTQPALSESQITSIAYDCNALPEVITDKTLVDFVRAIEAHCRGGNHG